MVSVERRESSVFYVFVRDARRFRGDCRAYEDLLLVRRYDRDAWREEFSKAAVA